MPPTSEEHWERIRHHFSYDDGFPRTGGVNVMTVAGGTPAEGDEQPKPDPQPAPQNEKAPPDDDAEDDDD